MPGSNASSDSTTSLTGRVVLGRYRIVRPLARGGMGVVYLGKVEGAAGFSKPVVVKSVIASFGGSEDNERMFAREAHIVSNLQHPGIVAVIDFGKVESSLVMVLEYVHGYNLGQWLRFVTETRRRVRVDHAVHIILSVLDTLEFAHGVSRPDGKALGIVHRDITPANVLLDLAGHIKLSDFGIARMADDEIKTREGLFRGTLPYAAPETLHGTSGGPKIDQYGAAVILYHLLAGKNPFKGAEPPETMTRVLTLTPKSISTVRNDVPWAIDAALSRALSKEPEERFDSIAEFAQAIRSGCDWSEREVAESFAAEIERDFTGTEMPERLGIESLALRDASWRDAQDVAVGGVSLSSSPPGIESGVRAHTNVDTPILGAKAGTPPSRRLWLWVVLAALAAGAGSALVLVSFSRPSTEHASRLVVIEKQGVEPAPAATGAPPTPDPAPAPAAPTSADSVASASPAPTRSAAARTAGSPGDNRGALLARAFQKQEGKIQGCFQKHSGDLQGEPQIAVRFRIDASGAVQNAVVSPAAVSGTPLGQCLAQVARATEFGPQPEPTSFSIPIGARLVRR